MRMLRCFIFSTNRRVQGNASEYVGRFLLCFVDSFVWFRRETIRKYDREAIAIAFVRGKNKDNQFKGTVRRNR